MSPAATAEAGLTHVEAIFEKIDNPMAAIAVQQILGGFIDVALLGNVATGVRLPIRLNGSDVIGKEPNREAQLFVSTADSGQELQNVSAVLKNEAELEPVSIKRWGPQSHKMVLPTDSTGELIINVQAKNGEDTVYYNRATNLAAPVAAALTVEQKQAINPTVEDFLSPGKSLQEIRAQVSHLAMDGLNTQEKTEFAREMFGLDLRDRIKLCSALKEMLKSFIVATPVDHLGDLIQQFVKISKALELYQEFESVIE